MIVPKTTLSWLRKGAALLPLVIMSLVAVAGFGCGPLGTFTIASGTSQSRLASAVSVQPAAAGVGETIRDGELAFVVTSVQRPGRTVAGRSGTKQTAQGEFVIVRVTLMSVGGQARRLSATDQFLLNDAGQRFAPSSAVTSLKDADKILLTSINPGSTVSGALLFDVPTGSRIASIELHDSTSSTGVRVALS